MKFRRTNKVEEFEVKKVKNKGAVSKKCRSCRDLSTLLLLVIPAISIAPHRHLSTINVQIGMSLQIPTQTNIHTCSCAYTEHQLICLGLGCVLNLQIIIGAWAIDMNGHLRTFEQLINVRIGGMAMHLKNPDSMVRHRFDEGLFVDKVAW